MMFGAQAAGNAQQFGPDLGKAIAAAKRIFGIIDQPSRIDAVAIDKDSSKVRIKQNDKSFNSAQASANLKEIKGKIEFRNVWFRYPTRKEDFVLKGLNLTINPCETVALVGESGCGKSTFVSLLMRFYDVDAGEILIDDVNVRDYNLHDLRTAMSMVMQEPVLFNYTITENILYGKPKASNSEILKSSEVANAIEFIENFDELRNQVDLNTASGIIDQMTSNKN